MSVTILSQQASIINQYLYELRDINIQKNPALFHRNIERIGMIAGYELSKQLRYRDHTTTTPLDTIKVPVLDEQLVIATILRAGLPLQRGIHSALDGAKLAFVAAARASEGTDSVQIKLDYIAAPSLEDTVLVLADTMLATGNSIVDSYEALIEKHGTPRRVFIVSVIASEAGVAFVSSKLPKAELIVGTVDPTLNDHFYIVPGLGDAGDLLYGPKL